MATDVHDRTGAPVPRPGTRVQPWMVALACCVVVTGVWAVLRWSGVAPFGSDNDEYRLVAQELLDSGRPVVAGEEATKYPLGYPLVLAAFDLVGLSVTKMAVALNLALVVGLGAVVVLLARSVGRTVALLPAALYAVAGAGVWGSVYMVMPDVAFTVVTGLVLWQAGRLRSRRDVWFLVGLVALATLLKSMGTLLAPAAAVAVLVAARPLRRLAWAPLAAGLGLTGIMAVFNLPYAEHTTGYARTFFLVQVTDAAAGEASLIHIAGRLFTRADLVLTDVGYAVVGYAVPPPCSGLLALPLLAAGVWAMWGAVTRRAYVLTFLAVSLPALALWPYSSVRFQLPLVPIAAMGVGWLAARLARALPSVGPAVAVAIVAVFLVASATRVMEVADLEAAGEGVIAADTALAATWAEANIPEGEVIASLAYREIAYRIDRPVVALGYTSDMDELWRTTREGDAEWLVIMPSLYGSRGVIEQQFVTTFADRLRLVHDTGTVDTYKIFGG